MARRVKVFSKNALQRTTFLPASFSSRIYKSTTINMTRLAFVSLDLLLCPTPGTKSQREDPYLDLHPHRYRCQHSNVSLFYLHLYWSSPLLSKNRVESLDTSKYRRLTLKTGSGMVF